MDLGTFVRLRRQPLTVAAALLGATLLAGAALRGGAAAPHLQPTPGAFTSRGAGPVHLSARLDRTAVMRGGDGLVRVELAVRGDSGAAGAPTRVPTDLVVVLDRSGSMDGEKIEHARAALRALVAELGPDDAFALVTYSAGAGVEIPLARATAGARAQWLATVAAVEPSGGTNVAAGLDAGMAVVAGARAEGRTPRLILISDGLANLGDTSREGLRARAARAVAGEYALSTVGVGLDFDEDLMSTLADAGTGNFYFLENAVDLAEIFGAEFATARETVATGLALALRPGPGVQVLDAAGYPVDRSADGAVVLRPGALFAGQERRIWVTLRVPSDAIGERPLGEFSATYTRSGRSETIALTGVPAVRCLGDEAAVTASVSADDWARAIGVDGVNALRRDAAAKIRDGRQHEALASIRAFQARTKDENARVGSVEVEKKLAELDVLAADVQASVAAPEPAKQRAAKRLQEQGLVEGRAGSRRAAGAK